jgi:RHS repeat-associated protein
VYKRQDLYNSAAGQVLEERQGSAVTNQYVWSLAYVNALILRDDNSTGGSYGKSSSGLGRRLYVQQDANFNVTTLTDTSGVVKQRFDYTPYGVMTVIDGTTNWSTTTDSYSWVYTFQGGRVDATVGMSHFGKREYSSSLGRWTEQDPASYINGANLYQFGLSAPVLYADPSGETADPATQPTTLPAPDTIDLGISVDSSVYGGGATIVPAMLGVLDRACQYCTDHYGTRRIHIAPHRSPNVLTAPEEYNRTNSPDILDTLDDVEGGAKIIITSKPVMSDGDAKGGIAFGKPGGGSHGAVITWPGGAAVLPHELGHIAGYDGGFPQGHAKPGSMVGDKPNLMCASGGDNPDEQWCKKLAQLAFQQWFKKYSNK